MTTVTDTMKTIAGKPDNTAVKFLVPAVRVGANGTSTITMRPDFAYPVNGAFSIDLDPGLVYAQIGGKRMPFIVPASGTARMGALIAAYTPT